MNIASLFIDCEFEIEAGTLEEVFKKARFCCSEGKSPNRGINENKQKLGKMQTACLDTLLRQPSRLRNLARDSDAASALFHSFFGLDSLT